MKKLITKMGLVSSLILSVCMISCTKQPECESSESISLIRDLIFTEINKQENKQGLKLSGIIYEDKDVQEFLDSAIIIQDFRKISIDKELKKCDCVANVKIKLSQEFIDHFNNLNENDYQRNYREHLFNSDYNFSYFLQLTNKNELYIETEFDFKELISVFIIFHSVKGVIAKNKKEEEFQNNSNVIINKKVTSKFLNENLGKEICYEELDYDSNSGGVLRVAIKYEEDNKITGEFGWYVNSDSGSWDGYFKGYIKNNIIYAMFNYYEEGSYFEDEIEIQLDDKFLKIKYFDNRITDMKIDKKCDFPYRTQNY